MDVYALAWLGAFAEDSQDRVMCNCDIAYLATLYVDNVVKCFHFADSPHIVPCTIAQGY